MKKFLFFLFLSGIYLPMLMAQDTLPEFSVKAIGNKHIVIGWTNNFNTTRQISIQRSSDSLGNFKTILTVLDPATPQNGYMDKKAPDNQVFYRLFIVLDKGTYLFSTTKRPLWDTAARKINPISVKITMKDSSVGLKLENNKMQSLAFTPSLYIYTSKDGYPHVTLPENKDGKKYSAQFFEDDGTFLFELKDIKEKNFKLDKTNFYHAGWFRFELYEDGKLLEKHKFYLEKDF